MSPSESNSYETKVMKVAIWLLLSLPLIAVLPKQPEPVTFEPTPQINKVEVKKTEPKQEVKEESPVKKVTWRDNPNKCDLSKQYVRKDNLECIDKPAEPKVTAQVNHPSGCEHYRHIVARYSWDVRTAMAILRAESGCNPNAANWADSHHSCTGSFGLFQLACFWTDTPFDPEHNIAKAFEIYSRSGWQPWGAWSNGSYLKYY